jgi:hypothetical protein
VTPILDEPNVIVVKYADTLSHKSLENATSVNPISGEPGVMVVRYADAIAYKSLENANEVKIPIGELDVIVVKYADTSWNSEIVEGIYILNLTIDSPEDDDFIPTPSVTVCGTASSPNAKCNGVRNRILSKWRRKRHGKRRTRNRNRGLDHRNPA